jgi:hypothetical protein
MDAAVAGGARGWCGTPAAGDDAAHGLTTSYSPLATHHSLLTTALLTMAGGDAAPGRGGDAAARHARLGARPHRARPYNRRDHRDPTLTPRNPPTPTPTPTPNPTPPPPPPPPPKPPPQPPPNPNPNPNPNPTPNPNPNPNPNPHPNPGKTAVVADAHIAPHYQTEIDSAAAALPDEQTAMCVRVGVRDRGRGRSRVRPPCAPSRCAHHCAHPPALPGYRPTDPNPKPQPVTKLYHPYQVRRATA